MITFVAEKIHGHATNMRLIYVNGHCIWGGSQKECRKAKGVIINTIKAVLPEGRISSYIEETQNY